MFTWLWWHVSGKRPCRIPFKCHNGHTWSGWMLWDKKRLEYRWPQAHDGTLLHTHCATCLEYGVRRVRAHVGGIHH